MPNEEINPSVIIISFAITISVFPFIIYIFDAITFTFTSRKRISTLRDILTCTQGKLYNIYWRIEIPVIWILTISFMVYARRTYTCGIHCLSNLLLPCGQRTTHLQPNSLSIGNTPCCYWYYLVYNIININTNHNKISEQVTSINTTNQ